MTEIISKSFSLERYRSSSSSFSSSHSALPTYSSTTMVPPNYNLPPPRPYVTIPPLNGPRPPPRRVENTSLYNQAPFMYENGRRYHGHRAGAYMYPNDELEKDRLDILHQLYLVAREQELHRAPICRNYTQTRILDLGTGTGIWSIDMADQYPEAEVIGVDLSPIQPEKIPANLEFKICDFESTWTFGQDSFDLIHLRNGCGSVSSWPTLYRKAFQHLKPGFGWIEQVEIDFQPRCDDNTLLPDSMVQEWYRHLADATHSTGKPLRYQEHTGDMLRNAGFVDIEEVILRVPYSPWPTQRQAKEIGSWYTLAMSEGLESLCIGPFSRVREWTPEQIKAFLSPVRKEMLSKRVHGYNLMYE